MSERCDYQEIKRLSDIILTVLQNGNKNYIFGCGWMGKQVLSVLQRMNIKISGFVVTNKSNEQESGIPVYSIDEMVDSSSNILVALRDQDEALNKKLAQRAEVVIPICYPKEITVLEARYYIDYLESKGLDCRKEILNMNGFEFRNPFYREYDYLLSWVYEAGDLILPVIYNDFSRIDEGPYEMDITELTEGDVVFDCGANIGLFSAVAMQKSCKVLAFEPMPKAVEYLEELKEKYPAQLEICPYALSDKIGKAAFHVQNFDLLGASLFENNNVIDEDYIVDVMTIDDYVKRKKIKKVDYIKADIEGSERDMLLGAKETIQKYSPKLSICTYHLPDDKEVLENIIREINPNYVIEHKWKKLYAYVPQ